MYIRLISIIAAILLISSYAVADDKDCSMQMNFDTPDATSSWRAVNDGVMGGLSSGGPRFEDEAMVFEGVINTNGGGFSSIRTDVEPGIFHDATGLKLRIKSDGRTYKVTLRTDARYRSRRISFQGEIERTPAGEWAVVTVPFSDLKASLFGRPVRGATFDKDAVQELGIILADGQDGPFRLDVKAIEACEM